VAILKFCAKAAVAAAAALVGTGEVDADEGSVCGGFTAGPTGRCVRAVAASTRCSKPDMVGYLRVRSTQLGMAGSE
jgi:hypothetical protein